MSAKTDESIVVVEAFSLSQVEFVIPIAGGGETVFTPNPLIVPVQKIERNEKEERGRGENGESGASPEQVRKGSVYVASKYNLRLLTLLDTWTRVKKVSPFLEKVPL